MRIYEGDKTPVDPALTRTLPRVGFDYANNTQLFAPLRMTRAMRLRYAHPPYSPYGENSRALRLL